MRLWSIHPKYLDPQGLVALWREALLAQAVLRGETKGYRHHSQLTRFQNHPEPLSAISTFLAAVHTEATSRGYSFDAAKVPVNRTAVKITVTSGQVGYEWTHLLAKLEIRSLETHARLQGLGKPHCHPLFKLRAGSIEPWEKGHVVTR
ncbi:MAG: pyrimidine dimer DNA glycosylase/endonuclease V [Gammaproteobacteria bacterium]